MHRSYLTARIAFFVAVALVAGRAMADPISLESVLLPVLDEYQLPACAAAVVKDGEIVAAGAVGVRRVGTSIPVTIDDRFHLGSDTKAMTALLTAMFVEAGKLQWTSTLADVFPELVEGMTPDLKGVTVEQFLSHTSGLPGDNDDFGKLLDQATLGPGNLDEMRYWLIKQSSRQPLASKPGTTFAYANLNYVIVGSMLERLSQRTWEELITERVFQPLQLQTAGLGPQSSPGRVDAPLGHLIVDGKPKAMLAGPNGDNTPVIGPAGVAHMSILDFARWAGWNAGQGRRGPNLVSPATLKKLHTPVISIADRPNAAPGTPSKGRYALGWGEFNVDWADGSLIYHGGSNNMNLAHIWLDPEHDVAMVLTTNISGEKADKALLQLAGRLYKRFATGSATE